MWVWLVWLQEARLFAAPRLEAVCADEASAMAEVAKVQRRIEDQSGPYHPTTWDQDLFSQGIKSSHGDQIRWEERVVVKA